MVTMDCCRIATPNKTPRRLRRALWAILVSCLPLSAAALDNLLYNVQGDDDALEAQVKAASLVGKSVRDERTTIVDLLSAARAEYTTLTGVLYGSGYYGGTVSVLLDGREAADLSPLALPTRINTIVVKVVPGSPFAFSRTDIKPQAPGTELPNGFEPGEIAYSGLISSAGVAAVRGWRDLGHAKADVSAQTVTAYHPGKKLDVQISVEPGPKLAFAEPIITGNSAVRTERVEEIAAVPVGQTFSPDAAEDAAARLRRTGAFSSVSLREGDAQPDGTIPMEITVVEGPSRRLGFGLELSSVEGLSVTGYWLHRNLRGGAERLRVEGAVNQIGGEKTDNGSGIDLTFDIRYQRPATFTPDTDLYLHAALERIDDPNYLSRGVRLEGGVTTIFSDKLTGAAGLGYDASRVKDALGERDFILVAAPFNLTWEGRDQPLDATSGLYVNALVEPFFALSGTDNGAYLTLDARSYLSFSEDRFVLAGRAQIGSLIGPSIDRAPGNMLFFAGGGGSVRGHPFQSLGVDMGGGVVTGGRSMLALSAELRAVVSGNIGVVAFADTGFIGPDSVPGKDGEWITGAGLGARYSTPIGPLRVDVGVPISNDSLSLSDVKLYIGIGQAF